MANELTWNDLAAGAATAGAAAADAATGDLIARCLAGEEIAHEALYEAHAATIYRLVYGMLRQREDAEEVLQDTFEYAFRRLHRYDSRRAAFKTWLYQIAISRCRNKRRRKWLPTFSINQTFASEIADPAAPAPADEAQLSQQQHLVWQALGDLSDKLRETALLRYYRRPDLCRDWRHPGHSGEDR